MLAAVDDGAESLLVIGGGALDRYDGVLQCVYTDLGRQEGRSDLIAGRAAHQRRLGGGPSRSR